MAVSLVSTGVTFPDSSTQTTAATGFGFKNRIINGAMVIDQRNAGASVTPTAAAYTLDRWTSGLTQASKFTVQRSTDAPAGFTNSLLVTSLSAYSVTGNDYFGVFQVIEGYNVADLNYGTASAQTITFSFWVKSSLTGSFGGSIENGAQNRCYSFAYTVSSANTWEYKTVTAVGDTTGTWNTGNTGGMIAWFGLGASGTRVGTAGAWGTQSGSGLQPSSTVSVVGTNGATFYITGVQLEKGSTATSFDYRPYGTELALCQRYYCKSFDQATAPAQNAGLLGAIYFGQPVAASTTGTITGVRFPVSMRTAPSTITIYNPSAANGQIRAVSGSDWSSTTIASATGENGFGIFSTSPAGIGAGSAAAYHFAATSEL
jgi:hypothetical protein